MQRALVRRRIDRNGAHPEPLGGARDAAGDFAAIGDEDGSEHWAAGAGIAHGRPAHPSGLAMRSHQPCESERRSRRRASLPLRRGERRELDRHSGKRHAGRSRMRRRSARAGGALEAALGQVAAKRASRPDSRPVRAALQAVRAAVCAGGLAACLRLPLLEAASLPWDAVAVGTPGIGGIGGICICPATFALDCWPAVTAAATAAGVGVPPFGSGFMMLMAGMESADGKIDIERAALARRRCAVGRLRGDRPASAAHRRQPARRAIAPRR